MRGGDFPTPPSGMRKTVIRALRERETPGSAPGSPTMKFKNKLHLVAFIALVIVTIVLWGLVIWLRVR